MDVSKASYYIEKKKNKSRQKGHTKKKIFLKQGKILIEIPMVRLNQI
jgi:hypothetical protein